MAHRPCRSVVAHLEGYQCREPCAILRSALRKRCAGPRSDPIPGRGITFLDSMSAPITRGARPRRCLCNLEAIGACAPVSLTRRSDFGCRVESGTLAGLHPSAPPNASGTGIVRGSLESGLAAPIPVRGCGEVTLWRIQSHGVPSVRSWWTLTAWTATK